MRKSRSNSSSCANARSRSPSPRATAIALAIHVAGAALAVLAVLAPSFARASACCGGSFAMPSLILGDDKAQVTFGVSRSKVEFEISEKGIWRESQANKLQDIVRIEGAHILSDRWQAGASTSITSHSSDAPIAGSASSESARTTGLADSTASLGYEFLTDWDYDLWTPKGVTFLQLTMPTGRSIHEVTDPSLANGKGLWSVGAGVALVKVRGPFDVSLIGEVHRPLDRELDSAQAQGTIRLHPSWGQSIALGGGWSKKAWRLGGTLEWRNEGPIAVEGAVDSPGAAARAVTASLNGNVMFGSEWALSMAFSDQTLFGDPQNTSLSRSITLGLQRRWAR